MEIELKFTAVHKIICYYQNDFLYNPYQDHSIRQSHSINVLSDDIFTVQGKQFHWIVIGTGKRRIRTIASDIT